MHHQSGRAHGPGDPAERDGAPARPWQGVSACVCVPIAPTIILCALGCAADGRSCAGPGGSRGEGCDPSTCEQPDVPIGDPRCVFRPDDQQWIIERDYDHWECSPVQGGDDATCVEMMITKFEEACPNGCAADGQSCATGPPTCDPALCTKRSLLATPAACNRVPATSLSSPSMTTPARTYPPAAPPVSREAPPRSWRTVPTAARPTGKSCASAGDVPAAPADFLALQNPGGTYFEWTDNSSNEDGFKIYFGGVSVGRPGTVDRHGRSGHTDGRYRLRAVRDGDLLGDLRLQLGGRLRPGLVLPAAVGPTPSPRLDRWGGRRVMEVAMIQRASFLA